MHVAHLTGSVQRRNGTSHVGVPRGQRSEASPESPPASQWTHNPRWQVWNTLVSATALSLWHCNHGSPHQCPPNMRPKSSRCWAALRPGRASEVSLFVLSQNWLCLTPQKPLQWLASSNFCCSYIVTIPTACWIIQPVLDACCSNESFMRVPVVSGRIWMASAIAMQRLKTRKRGTFKMSRPKASPGALYRQPATGLRLEKETTNNKKNTTFEWRTLTDLILRRWLLSDSYSRIRTPSSRSRSNEEYEVDRGQVVPQKKITGHKKNVSLRHKGAFLRAT